MSETLNADLIGELRDIMEEEFPSLLETFVSESARQYLDVRNAFQTGEMEVLRRAAHSLKGSCGNIGAERLKDTCEVIESSAREGMLDGLEALIQRAEGELDAVNQALQSYT